MTAWLRTAWTRLTAHPDRGGGGISLMVILLVPVALLVLGLVVDGGGKARAIGRADNIAEEAARAGTTGVNIGALGQGSGQVLDANAAVAAARNYLAAAGVPGTVAVEDGNRLTVTVTISQPTVLLGMIGVDQWTVTGHGAAQLLRTG
jgi:Flp pilus assembly protein TadG